MMRTHFVILSRQSHFAQVNLLILTTLSVFSSHIRRDRLIVSACIQSRVMEHNRLVSAAFA